jgi:hypothetical protein
MKKPQKKPTNNYVDNEKFYNEIVKWKAYCRDEANVGNVMPQIPEFCGKCIYDIANGYSLKPKFVNYSFRDIMISDAIEDCVKYFDKFDEHNWNNPFAYYTRICHFAFVNRINEEEKNRYATYKHFDETITLSDHKDLMVDDDNSLILDPVYDNISDFISRFEDKMEKKREKKKERLKEKKRLEAEMEAGANTA